MSGLWFCIFVGGTASLIQRFLKSSIQSAYDSFHFLGKVYNNTPHFLGYSNKTVINLAMILRDIWRERTETTENKVENEKRQKKACRQVFTTAVLICSNFRLSDLPIRAI